MCKVIVVRPKEYDDFILYNHMYSRKAESFTINEIVEEMSGYQIHMSEKEVQSKVNDMVKEGMVIRNIGSYSRAVMV